LTEILFRLDKKTINESAFFKSLDTFLKLFPEKEKNWFDRSVMRIYDVVYLGKHGNRKEFKVYRNEKLDKYDSRFSYYRVYLYSHNRGWCSCFYGKYGQERMVKICTHIGACILFDLYVQNLMQSA